MSGDGMTPEAATALREPFEPAQIGKLPKAGTTLDYVGHAAVTDRLLKVDPFWSWEPLALDPDGGPLIRFAKNDAELWIKLTICGVTRIGVGTAGSGSFELSKQLIGDAIRNAAMRFGVALDLWTKQDLHDMEHPGPVTPIAVALCPWCDGPTNDNRPVQRKDGLFWHKECIKKEEAERVEPKPLTDDEEPF